ncbi:hypothetical protein BBP40_004336 [Aspergillus hancockii]|nr:hypothetical protein BBP40_004336 [Aspergillus hancockii]
MLADNKNTGRHHDLTERIPATADDLLSAFMVPLLPYVLEQRMGLGASRIQAYTSIFLAEGAFVSIVTSPLVGSVADRTESKKVLLLGLLILTLASVLCLALTAPLVWLFIGRFVQCIASNALWIGELARAQRSRGSSSDWVGIGLRGRR